MATKVTKKAFVEAIMKYENSDNVNPMEGIRCLYTSADGTRHCIIGQVLEDLGIGAPSALETLGAAFLTQVEWEDGLTGLVSDMQWFADGNKGDEPPEPRPWKEVIAHYKHELV